MQANSKDLQSVLDDPNKALTLGLFNANRHVTRSAFEEWEKEEIGYNNGVLNAYKKLLSTINDDLSREIIEQIYFELFKDDNYSNIYIGIMDINTIAIPKTAFKIPPPITETEII